MNQNLKKAIITLVAVLGYGGWAVFSNWSSEHIEMQSIAIRAGIIQGSYSGLLTLITVILLEKLFLSLNTRLPCGLNMFVTVFTATLVQYSIIIPVHIFNGTPNILLTLLPGFVIGTAFSTAYLVSVKNQHYPKHSS